MSVNPAGNNSIPEFEPVVEGRLLPELRYEEAFVVALYALGVAVNMFRFADAIGALTGTKDTSSIYKDKIFMLAASNRGTRDDLEPYSIYPYQHSPSAFQHYPRVVELMSDSAKMEKIFKALIPHNLSLGEAMRHPVFAALDVNARAHWLLRANGQSTPKVAKIIGDYVLAENPRRPWDVDIASLVGKRFAPYCPDIIGALNVEFQKYINEQGRTNGMSKGDIMREIQTHHDSLTKLYQALGEQNGQRNY